MKGSTSEEPHGIRKKGEAKMVPDGGAEATEG